MSATPLWHVTADLRREWIEGRLTDDQAWSVEAHLEACERCRDAVASGWGAARRPLPPLPPQGAARPSTPWRRARALLGWRDVAAGQLIVLVSVLVAAAVLDERTRGTSLLPWSAAARPGDVWLAGRGSWLTLIAPLAVVTAVGAASGPWADPAHRIVIATPFGGLRLVLWRTLGVVAVAVPATFAVAVANRERVGGDVTPSVTLWLLPTLALCAATLALGGLVGVRVAALVVGGVWAGGTVGPILAGLEPVLLIALDPGVWALLAALGIALTVLAGRRPTSFPGPRPTRSSLGGHA